MSSVRVYQVDAFTDRRFTGNPAGVVLDADELSLPDMRALARELGAADSAFVLQPDADDHDLRVRFVNPHGEAAFIGHATLAVHTVLATLRQLPRPRQKQAAGIVHVERLAGTDPLRIAIHQPPPPLPGPPQSRPLLEVLDALSLSSAELDPRCPPALAGGGSTRLLVGVQDSATLARLQPDNARLATVSTRTGIPGVFVFTLRPGVAGAYTEARMFCPALGIPEDPVSGNAHALLGAYLLQQGLLPADGGASPAAVVPNAAAPNAATPAVRSVEFTGAQGHHLQRPGRVTVALGLQGTALRSVSIIGAAVVAFTTTVEF